jgi:hypothetical protein
MTVREYLNIWGVLIKDNPEYLDLPVVYVYSDESGAYELDDAPKPGMFTKGEYFIDDIDDFIGDEEYYGEKEGTPFRVNSIQVGW